MNDRKAARKALAALIEDNVPTFAAVYDHESLDIQGKTPICMVYSDGSQPGPEVELSGHGRQHALLISIWWERGDSTEDDIDDLSAEVFTVLEDNYGTTDTWSGMAIDDAFSQMDYPLAGQYRREQIRVIIF